MLLSGFLTLMSLIFLGKIGSILILCVGMTACMILFYLWIYRPYKKCEGMLQRFAEGYVQISELDSSEVMLSEGLTEVTREVSKMMNSEQIMNLNKRQAQYLALQNQINPHFLYNTLDGIRSEALIAGLDTVANMTEALASFFRYTISKVENLVSVSDELDNCLTYFKIQQYRFGDRLQLKIDMDEEEAETINQLMIPKLTLQPILENSIIHGTELKIGVGLTTISFELTSTRLIIHVEDNGVGMSEDKLKELNQKIDIGKFIYSNSSQETKGGIALANVNNRIHLIFGEEYGMHVFSREHVGTVVDITIPIVKNDNTKTKLYRSWSGNVNGTSL